MVLCDGRLDISRLELSEWIVLVLAEGKSYRSVWEKESFYFFGRWLYIGAVEFGIGILLFNVFFFLILMKVCGVWD